MKEFQTNIGRKYFELLFVEYEHALLSIGGTMQSFFNNLNSLNESLLNHVHFGPRFVYLNKKYTGYLPNFRCEEECLHNSGDSSDQYVLKIYTIQEKTTPFINNFYAGFIEQAAKMLWNLEVKVDKFKTLELALNFFKIDLAMSDSGSEMDVMKHLLGYKVTLLNRRAACSQLNSFISNENQHINVDDLYINIDLFK